MRCPFWIACLGTLPLVIGLGLTPGCRSTRVDNSNAGISAPQLRRHIEVLASDDFEGRAPGTRGEKLTIAYLTSEFRQVGLTPVMRDGTFVQRVPLVGSTATEHKASFNANEQQLALQFPTQFVAWTKQVVPEVKVDNSEVVFVGYGVVAPEYGWDDYKGVDVRGKTIVFLINDPAVPDVKDPVKLDPAVFKGNEMTYYGRWTYKYEIAAQKGAAAAIIVHETGPAGYPWAVVMGSNSRENFDLRATDGNTNRAPVEGWMTLEKAREVFAAAGQDFDKLKHAATSRDFKPVPLRATASFSFKNTVRDVMSYNVLGRVEGSDSKLKDECVAYTAHWDHLGIEPGLPGDKVFNGARDNATGVATLLEIARAFTQMKTPPKRSVVFLAVTAEEKGLLGAKYYAANPVLPIDRTLANINMDSMNPWGRTRDVTVIGMGQTTIEDVLREAAAAQGRRLIPDPEPEKGRYFRSDHFEFAKVGVPGLYLHPGIDFIGRPPGYGLRKAEEYIANDYHKVTDEIKQDWDLSGAVEDTALLYDVGRRIANASRRPAWKEGSEFRHLRPR